MAPERVVAVRWDDAHVEPNALMTCDELAASQLVEFVTFGVIVRDDDRVLGVAAEVTDAGYRGVTMIPRGMVREIVPVGTWPPRARRQSRRPSAAPATVPSDAPDA